MLEHRLLKQRGGARLGRGAAIVAAGTTFALLPAFLLLGALRRPGLPPPNGFDWVPNPAEWGNFGAALRTVELSHFLWNSVVVVVIAVPVTLVVASLAGFAIVAARPRQRVWLVTLTVLALMVPAGALWVPRFAVFEWLGLTDTIWPVVAPALMATTPFAVLLFALAYRRIPATLFEAAAVDGVPPLVVWWRVAVPLGRSATFAVAMVAFAFHWSNYVDPLLYLSSPQKATASLGLARLTALEAPQLPVALAAAVLVTVPAVIAFLLAQRALFDRVVVER